LRGSQKLTQANQAFTRAVIRGNKHNEEAEAPERFWDSSPYN